MEKITQEFKKIAKVIGFLSLYQVCNMITGYLLFSNADLSGVDAATQVVVPIAKVVSVLPFALSFLVHLYLCIKAHREADDPSPAKLHIVLAVIWMIGNGLSVIGSIGGLVEGVTLMKVLDLLIAASTVVLLFFYSKYAKEIRTRE